MSHDMRHRRIMNGGTTDDAYNDTLLLLEAKLALTNKGLHDFSKMPFALSPIKMLRVNPQLAAKLDYDRDVLHGYINQNFPRFNICQEITLTTVFNVIAQGEGVVFFLDGPSGSGKTFVYKVLLALVRRNGHVTIGVASSGIAALLLEGGRTAHSVFKIPIALGRDSMCSIPLQSDSAELLREAKLIVWDKAPTQHRHYAEAIDRTLRNIMRRPYSPFGGKVVVFGGDFRQCALVVSRGSREVTVSAALSRLVLWHQVRILTLTKNMRLRANPLSKPYAEYLLRVDNGEESFIINHFPPKANAKPSIGVEIALYLEIHQAPSLKTLIHVVFSALAINYANQGYMDGRAILTTKNIIVNSLNTQIVEAVPGQKHIFLLADLVETGDDQAMAIGPEFLNTITLVSMPPHRLALKVGVPVMLLRNLDATLGLCNGTRLIISRVAWRLIVA
ncbi:hypothetical protein CY35_11G060800 [Sphagnum magellanicum]|nr:hypothetical protein CY35_11G060800 [Sphagnum magellanicum]